MKKGILFALIAIMFLALLTGCRAYRRTVVTTPGTEVTTNTDGNVTRGFHYRHDGHTGGDRVTRGTTSGAHHRAHRAHTPHRGGHHYRHDGMVTDTDGVIGNGTFADRSADGTHTARRAMDSADTTTRHANTRANRAAGLAAPGQSGGNTVGIPGVYAR